MKNLLEERAYMALRMTMEKQCDRELLGFAAKAAGIDGVYREHDSEFGIGLHKDMAQSLWWNPLTDDRDALRLAVKLALTIKMGTSAPIPNIGVYRAEGGASVIEKIVGDAGHSTRRAIVRAAAEIGRRMQDDQSTGARC